MHVEVGEGKILLFETFSLFFFYYYFLLKRFLEELALIKNGLYLGSMDFHKNFLELSLDYHGIIIGFSRITPELFLNYARIIH